MKKLALGIAMALGLATAAFADPLEGTWRTAPDDNGNTGLIQVGKCGDKLCGTLVKAFDSSAAEMASKNVGRRIIWDTVNTGDGVYKGRLYSPDRDKEYKSKLVLEGNRLSVSGCIILGCREGGRWVKQ